MLHKLFGLTGVAILATFISLFISGCSKSKSSNDELDMGIISSQSIEQTVANFVANSPDQASKLGVGVSVRDSEVDSTESKHLSQVPSEVMLANGKKQNVMLMSKAWLKKEVAGSLKVAASARNWLEVYQSRFASLSNADREKVVNPLQLKGAQKAVIKTKLLELMKMKNSHGPSRDVDLPVSNSKKFENILEKLGVTSIKVSTGQVNFGLISNYVEHDCSEEYGFELGSDVTGAAEAFSSTGIMKKVPFKLRTKMTCVKNQGYRGSCNAFALVGAVEALISRDYGMFVNLSEQQAYFWMLTEIDKDESEGASTSEVIEGISSERYQFYVENQWNYNPGYYRDICPGDSTLAGCASTDQNWTSTFGNICAGYSQTGSDWNGYTVNSIGGEMCTETVHEATLMDGHSESEGASAFSIPGSSTTIRIGNTSLVWDLTDTTSSLELVKDYLKDGVPLVVGMATTNSLHAPSSGYVSSYTSDEAVRGGHAVLLIGAIDNDRLPSGAPAGIGGGYLVLKNSWGSTGGDHGYYYIPYQYALDRFTHVYPIETLVL